ncbi:hypothetical protein [Modestobacter sp. KNN46-3]|uniref:hypothetical protein n=1 Tax=Modestobacter sp. KNN46-3 TaxID=2711218 RepID=UPI0013E0D4C8|nr:hypothetical protein [Modestobacter sp. KNN46-3]
MSDQSLARITALLPLRPVGDPVALAHWYIAGQDHEPGRGGEGCQECWDTLTGILGGAAQASPEDSDPIERTALELLELWYGLSSTRISIRVGPGLPSFDPRRLEQYR